MTAAEVEFHYFRLREDKRQCWHIDVWQHGRWTWLVGGLEKTDARAAIEKWGGEILSWNTPHPPGCTPATIPFWGS